MDAQLKPASTRSLADCLQRSSSLPPGMESTAVQTGNQRPARLVNQVKIQMLCLVVSQRCYLTVHRKLIEKSRDSDAGSNIVTTDAGQRPTQHTVTGIEMYA